MVFWKLTLISPAPPALTRIAVPSSDIQLPPMGRQRRVTMTPNPHPPGLFFCPTQGAEPRFQEGRDVVKRTWIFSPTESLRPSSTHYWPITFLRFALYSSCVSQRKVRPKHPAQQVIIKNTRPREPTTNYSNVPDYIWPFNQSQSPPVVSRVCLVHRNH